MSSKDDMDIARNFKACLPSNDALPYYDDEIDRIGMRAKVERELAEEMKKGEGSVTSDRLPPSIDIREGPNPLNALDLPRYQLNDPDQKDDELEWQKSISNAETQLMHSEIRLTNLELMKKFGSNQWRLHNFQQENYIKQFSKQLEELQRLSDSLNRQRKEEQTKTGEELSRLSKRWAELLNKSLNVELANVDAQNELEELQLRKEELQKKVNELDKE